MLGKRPQQTSLYDVGNVYDLELPTASFYAQLAQVSQHLFKDDDFATFYTEHFGRPSIAPSLLALTMVLQHHDMVSDEEATQRTAFDLRWVAVLGRYPGKALCAKSTLQLFRSHLILHPEVRSIFQTSIDEAKRAGLLGKSLRIALDTKPILGRGAVMDTYNLLAEGILKLARALSVTEKVALEEYLRRTGLERYNESSIKGNADIDWSDIDATQKLLTTMVADGQVLLAQVTSQEGTLAEAAILLQQILCQDIVEKPTPDGGVCAEIKEGTAKDRVPSISDPEVRHGRKSASKLFVGHKADIAVDIETQVIVAVDILAGNAGDAANTLSQVKQSEENTGLLVEETTGDCAYGSGDTRNTFAEEKRVLHAKVPKEAKRGDFYPKSSFIIDLENGSVTCPAKHVVKVFTSSEMGKVYHFGKLCCDCALKSLCTKSKTGRSISVLPHEALVRKAREFQSTPDGRKILRERVVVEHRLARLGQLGIGQARYFGRLKTKFQLSMAAAIANFRLIWNWQAKTAVFNPI